MCFSWISYIEAKYNLVPDENIDEKFKPNLELMQSISNIEHSPTDNWSIECDEELVELLKDVVNTDMPGSIRNLIKTISVSTQRVSFKISKIWNFMALILIKLQSLTVNSRLQKT